MFISYQLGNVMNEGRFTPELRSLRHADRVL